MSAPIANQNAMAGFSASNCYAATCQSRFPKDECRRMGICAMKTMLAEVVRRDAEGHYTCYSRVDGANSLAQGLLDSGMCYRTTEKYGFHYCLRPTEEGKRRMAMKAMPHNEQADRSQP